MNTSLILTANRSNARLYEYVGANQGLRLVDEFVNDGGRWKDHETATDRPGRIRDRGKFGRHSMSPSERPRTHIARTFAREIAMALDERRSAGQYTRVILVAEPRFLGILKTELSPEVLAKVSAAIPKELDRSGTKSLTDELSEYLPAI